MPGRGAIDFAATLAEIKKTGYDGWLTVELYPYLDDPDAAAREAREYLMERCSIWSAKPQAELRRGMNWRAYFELMRFPAVFTAVADVMMGYLVTHGNLQPGHVFALSLVASISIYLAGMVLNDVFDAEVDARERPERPIPSGRIALRMAKRLGWDVCSERRVFAWLASVLARDWRPGRVGTLLAGCIVLYDVVLKRTPLPPRSWGLVVR